MKGTLEADFSQLSTEADKSIVKLREMQAEADKVGPAVDQIGSKAPSAFGALITSADTAGTAIKGLGAETETAEAWLARSLRTTQDLTVATVDLVVPVTTARGALTEMGEAAGLTVANLGNVGAASVVVTTAMAAWDFGRAIAGWLNLDDKIAHTTATLLGWGDAQAEASGAKQDTINLAIQHGADAHIAYADAIAFNTARVNEFNTALTRSHAPEESAKAIAGWHAELALVRDAGVLPGLTADVASHNFSIKDLGQRYGISTEAIQFFARETKAASDSATKDATAAATAIAAAQKEYGTLLKEVQKLEADKNTGSLKGLLDLSAAEQKASQTHFEEQVKGIDQIEKAQAKQRDVVMKSTLEVTDYQIMKIWERADAEIKAFKGTEDQVKTHADIVYTTANYEAQAITDAMAKAVDATAAKAEATLVALLTAAAGSWAQYQAALDAATPTMFGTRPLPLGPAIHPPGAGTSRYVNGVDTWGVQTRDAGGPVTAGSSYLIGGGRAPELFTPGASGFVTPGGGGGTTINIHVTQPLGTPDAIARAVEQAMTSSLKNSGTRLPTQA